MEPNYIYSKIDNKFNVITNITGSGGGCQELRRRCDCVIATPGGGMTRTARVNRSIFASMGTSRALPFLSGNQALSRGFGAGGTNCGLSVAAAVEKNGQQPSPRSAPARRIAVSGQSAVSRQCTISGQTIVPGQGIVPGHSTVAPFAIQPVPAGSTQPVARPARANAAWR